MSAAFDPAADGWAPYSDAGFIDHVGPLWTSPTDSGVLGFVAEPKHANLLGVVQGGMLMTFGDRALGIAAWRAADGQPSVTVQFDMHFVSAARIGEFVIVRPEIVRRTPSMVFMRGVLLVKDRPIATAGGIWKVLRAQREPLTNVTPSE